MENPRARRSRLCVGAARGSAPDAVVARVVPRLPVGRLHRPMGAGASFRHLQSTPGVPHLADVAGDPGADESRRGDAASGAGDGGGARGGGAPSRSTWQPPVGGRSGGDRHRLVARGGCHHDRTVEGRPVHDCDGVGVHRAARLCRSTGAMVGDRTRGTNGCCTISGVAIPAQRLHHRGDHRCRPRVEAPAGAASVLS